MPSSRNRLLYVVALLLACLCVLGGVLTFQARATGEFAEQYTESADSVIEVLEQNESVMDGTVTWAGVVSVDADSATVIAATTGTVANKASRGEPVPRRFRIQLTLELVHGEWLTSNLEFVG
jgi:Mce-associated membrane protein